GAPLEPAGAAIGDGVRVARVQRRGPQDAPDPAPGSRLDAHAGPRPRPRCDRREDERPRLAHRRERRHAGEGDAEPDCGGDPRSEQLVPDASGALRWLHAAGGPATVSLATLPFGNSLAKPRPWGVEPVPVAAPATRGDRRF